jgi:hypothetical protein
MAWGHPLQRRRWMQMRDFDVQTVELKGPFERAFRYLADPRNLPEWTHAFRSVDNGRATLATPRGSVVVGLEVRAAIESGTVDWFMTFPDGSVGRAFSRLTPLDHARVLYSFVLLAPPVPLEQVEGALAEQAKVLRQELTALQERLARA